MQNLFWKIAVIVVGLGLCLWSVYPPDQKIRRGKDLQGGTSLIYVVKVPDGTPDKSALLAQTISVLKDRVNPNGVLDISMQPLGTDRIEIIMPLPTEQVLALRGAYEAALGKLMQAAQIDAASLDAALQSNQAVALFGGESPIRVGQMQALQKAYQTLQDAKMALAQATTAASAEADLNKLEQAVADAQLNLESLHDAALQGSLEQARVVRVLNLPTRQTTKEDATGAPVLDDNGKPVLMDSPRQLALATLKADFPHLSELLDAAVLAFDTYQTKRTTLDDPEDLIRLLRGAGVLDFRIAVTETKAEGINIRELRDQLLQRGPDNVDSSRVGWFPVNDLKQWYKSPEQLAQLEADPASYFSARQGLVGERFEGQYYILLHTTKDKSMTHTADSKWTVQSTGITKEQRLGRDAVAFRLDANGGTLMSRMTGAHVGEPMAIVLDGQVYSAPNLNSQIGSSGIIEGDFNHAELTYLIRVLAAGALEARLSDRPIAISTLGPTIGADNLKAGLTACLWSVIAVAGFMLLYYFQAGLVAILAVVANAVIVFGVMALIQGTFTLPGLAGIALTIGTAVDANILIYERIREELEAGEDLKTAIRLGYGRAFSSIIDANVTNLIVCVVLLYTATTEVKGFALTMMIGIFGTLVTALFMTRVWYDLAVNHLGLKRMPMLATTVPAVKRFLQPHVDWIGLRRVFIPVSLILVVGSWVLIASRGVQIFDTEFRGGLSATMRTKLDPSDPSGKAHIFLKQLDVEQGIREIGERYAKTGTSQGDADKEGVLRELRNVEVLTVGDTKQVDGLLAADAFQIKVALPAAIGTNTTISNTIVAAIVDRFGNDLDVTRPLAFNGVDSVAHANFTFPVTDPDLGANINRPTRHRDVKEFLGGVAVVVDGITPPATTQDIEGRIRKMRNQPDFRDVDGRKVGVFGLDPADPSDPSKGFRSVAVFVADPSVNYSKVEFDTWDKKLASREWSVVSQSLQRPASLEQVSEFSSAVAETLRANAIVATLLSVLGILIYIWIRFGSLRYSAGAVVALVHDVSIGLGALALSQLIGSTGLGKAILLEEFHIDLEVVAAVLTLIGYSLNDTIVVLDRIRENRGKLRFPTAEIVNKSINQTFSRTTLTSFTMIISLGIMYVAGGTGIRAFSFVMLVGMIVGTYSSIAIAAPLVFKGHDEPELQRGGPAPHVAQRLPMPSTA